MNYLITADGNTEQFTLSAGYHAVSAVGGFGGGTAKLQYMPTNTDAVDVPSATFTSAGVLMLSLGSGRYRWNVAGSTTPTLTVGVSD